MLSNLTHLRELHLLDKEYFKVLLNAVVCSSTHLSHKMRRTGAPSPAQPETSTGKSRWDLVNAFHLFPGLHMLFCCCRHLQLPSVYLAAEPTAPLNLSAAAAAARILPLLSQMHLDLQALKTARAALERLKTQDPGHQAAAAAVMRTQTVSQC